MDRIKTIEVNGRTVLAIETYNGDAFIGMWRKQLEAMKMDPHYIPCIILEPIPTRLDLETIPRAYSIVVPKKPLVQRIKEWFLGSDGT